MVECAGDTQVSRKDIPAAFLSLHVGPSSLEMLLLTPWAVFQAKPASTLVQPHPSSPREGAAQLLLVSLVFPGLWTLPPGCPRH